jgi:hypothetical protein
MRSGSTVTRGNRRARASQLRQCVVAGGRRAGPRARAGTLRCIRRPFAARAVDAANPVDRLGVAHGVSRPLAARHEDRIHRAAHVARRALRDQLEPGGHAHRPCALGDQLDLIAGVAALLLFQQP